MTMSIARARNFALALLAMSGGAQAAVPQEKSPVVFTFGAGNNNVSDGNARVFTASSADLGSYSMRATAWSLDSAGVVRDSALMMYDGGLGVISGDDAGGADGRHTIDNSVRKDFIILQFNRQVKMVGAVFNTFSVLGGTKDSDAILKYGTTSIDWTQSLNLNDKNVSALNALFSGTMTSNTTSTGNRIAELNPNRFSGDIWLIGAAWNNPDSRIDGFKISHIAVIPEPGTWALMIGGFGLVGATMRRRAGRTIATA